MYSPQVGGAIIPPELLPEPEWRERLIVAQVQRGRTAVVLCTADTIPADEYAEVRLCEGERSLLRATVRRPVTQELLDWLFEMPGVES